MVKILRYNMDEPPMMSVEDDAVMIKSTSCVASSSDGTIETPETTEAPASTEDSSSMRIRSVGTSLTLLVGSYLMGASAPAAVGLSALTAMTFNAPMAVAQTSVNGDCESIVEIEVRGPAPEADTEDLLTEIESLRAENAQLLATLNTSVSMEEAELMQFSILADNFAKQDFVSASLPVDRTLDKVGKFIYLFIYLFIYSFLKS